MHTDLYAAAMRFTEARPLLVDVVPAREIVPHFAAGGACHAGPPIASTDMWAPMRAALGAALALEGVADTLSGTGERWFTGPAALPDPARLEPGFGPEDMQRDLGDSAIVEVYGLGALAATDHPSRAWSSGPAILGVDATAVVHERSVPPIHTGIAHREPGVGQIGGGVTLPPIEAFDAAVAALEPVAALA
jgi:hypothetical protein